jgi:RimJ/RimL family protein N-acetyltransferase
MPDPAPVPEVIDLGDGFVLTRARPGDEGWIAVAVEQSFDHLHPWMEWATPELTSVDAQSARMTRVAGDWERGEEYGYLVRHGRDPRVVGSASLIRRPAARFGMAAWEIGYWTHVDWCRRGLATRAARALVDVAFGFADAEAVVIRCDQANLPSAAIPRALGFTLDAIVDAPMIAPAHTGRDMVWLLRRDAAHGQEG